MKKALMFFVVFVLILLCSLNAWCEPVSTAQPEDTATVEGGVEIPVGIVFGILAAAVGLGGYLGYYYARKQK